MTRTIKRQILKVWNDNRVNICNIKSVARIAFNLGLYELVDYLDDRGNRLEFNYFTMTGQADIEDDGTEDEYDDDEMD